ncbi:MAG: DUF4294 domain-containing protein [Bacteroidota bacterium]
MPRILVIVLIFLSCAASAQTTKNVEEVDGVYLLETMVVDGDTIPVVTLQPKRISAYRKSRSKRYKRKWDKMHRNVVKVYPYAKVAGDLINEYNRNLDQLETEAERDAYLDQCEKDLKAEFEGDLRKMTTSQGRVLIKLIDRETGQTSYELIKDLKSGFTAFMWQGVAKLFGTNLKDNYDPNENETDDMIEEIVLDIEAGLIPVKEREVTTKAAEEVLANKSKRLQRKIDRQKKRNAKKEGG